MGIDIRFNIYSPHPTGGGGGGGGEGQAPAARFAFKKKNAVKKLLAKKQVRTTPTYENEFVRDLEYFVDSYPETIEQASLKARGSFTYKAPTNKAQVYNTDINNVYDAILIMAILTNKVEESYLPEGLPAGYTNVYNLIRNAGYPLPTEFIYKFQPRLEGFLSNTINRPYSRNGKTLKTFKTTKNPVTRRDIKVGGPTYMKVFKNIKLRKVIYNSPEHISVREYEVNEYCVKSYLQNVLSQNDFNKISKQLEETNNTPTYPQLTTILNTIDYNLDVYIIDYEKIQSQKEYKNTLRILIHDTHLYDLRMVGGTSIKTTIQKTINVDDSKFNTLLEENKLSYSETNNVIVKGIKYVRENRFNELDTTYKFRNYFSHVNIDFYENCFIRASRYYNNDPMIEYANGLDINGCYLNIFSNDKYSFPVQTGEEKTELFNKHDKIFDYGFYYCQFLEYTETEKAIFGSKNCWIMGYCLSNLPLKVNILYKHVAKHHVQGQKSRHFDNYQENKILLTHFTGTLAVYKKNHDINYNTSDNVEKQALLLKYPKAYGTNKGTTLSYDKYCIKSGFYAYLGILSYSKYQLYRIYQEMNKKYSCDILKIYTDSIAFNIKIEPSIDRDDEGNKIPIIHKEHASYINNILKKENISVKGENKSSSFINVEHDIKYTGYEERKLNNCEVKDTLALLSANKSFCMVGRGGYGKTHHFKTVIKKYFEDNNIKYELTSTTKENAEQIGGLNIQSLLSKKDSSLSNILDYFKNHKYIIVDETSQITSNLMNILHYIKSNLGVKLIMIGDINQCGSVDNRRTWMNTKAFKDLVEYNFVNFRWTEFSRYDKNYDQFLDKVLKMFDKCNNREEINYFISEYFYDNGCDRNEEKETNKMILVWSHNMGKKLNKEGHNYNTVHNYQGKTIKDKYSIYEWDRMPREILYTALSRASKKDFITLCYY